MQVVSRISLPKSADVASLYVQHSGSATIGDRLDGQEVACCQGDVISFNSYFNSIYESFYTKYTNLDSVYYLLKLKGDFQVSVYREVYEGKQELLSTETFENCQTLEYVKVSLPNLQQNHTRQGRIYLDLKCLSNLGVFEEGLLASEQQPSCEISLAIISCTFKKEAYIKNTVKTILQDKLLQTKQLKVFVVDNGHTLSSDDFSDARVDLIPNRNVGGSGGFTTGLITALQSSEYSHFLFMDDDIELESESIHRLFTLYEYAKSDFAVAGTMLDLAKKYVLYEAGALYGKHPDTKEISPFSVARLKPDLELQTTSNLNSLLLDEDIDYGGFWFFAFSKQLVEEIGLLLPFFIKVDDMEFGLRIKASCSQIVAFPSIAVWHEPFYGKFPLWDIYYYTRNNLITHAIHGSIGYISTVIQFFTSRVISNILLFEYKSAEMVIKAFEDYIKGPDYFKNCDPELLHADILKLSKSYKTQSIQSNYLPVAEQQYPRIKANAWKKLVSLLTLNGHFLPNLLISDEGAFLWQTYDYAGQRSRAFAKRKISVYKQEGACLFQNEIDKKAGIKLLARWLKVATISGVKWSSVSKKWKQASGELVSTEFWQQYLEKK